jgi:hypothetical protein
MTGKKDRSSAKKISQDHLFTFSNKGLWVFFQVAAIQPKPIGIPEKNF